MWQHVRNLVLIDERQHTWTINAFKHLFLLVVSPNVSIDWHHLWDGWHSWNRPLATHIPPSRTCVPTNSHFESRIHIARKCMLTCEERLKEWHWCQWLNNVMPNMANIQKKEPYMASNCLTSTLWCIGHTWIFITMVQNFSSIC